MSHTLLNEILVQLALSEKIEEMLPGEQYAGFTVISMVVDKYSERLGISSRQAWKILYNVAMAVCDEMGEYRGESKR